MSIQIIAESPLILLENIKTLIDNKEIVTWEYDSEGDFTHSASQWAKKAWFHPFIIQNELIFGILCTQHRAITVEEYAIFHGRFLEMLLSHFDESCQKIEISPLPTKYDTIKPRV